MFAFAAPDGSKTSALAPYEMEVITCPLSPEIRAQIKGANTHNTKGYGNHRIRKCKVSCFIDNSIAKGKHAFLTQLLCSL